MTIENTSLSGVGGGQEIPGRISVLLVLVTFSVVTLAVVSFLPVILFIKRLNPLMMLLPNPAEVVSLMLPCTVSSKARNTITLYGFILATDLPNCSDRLLSRITALSCLSVGD